MFEKDLSELRRKNILRTVVSRSSCQSAVITIRGKKYSNFASNDYLGLAQHPAIGKAASAALDACGFGSGASRLLAGGSHLHGKLEKAVASFKKRGAALLLNSGYDANTGIIPAISSREDVIFSDALNHASIIDGCRLSRADTVVYRHRDMGHLRELVLKGAGRRKIIVTDTVFSMDGHIAPLQQLYDLCTSLNAGRRSRPSVLLYLDDAHGTGVLGKGRGALSHFGLEPRPWIIEMGTFSKAFGSFGAFVAAEEDVIQWIANRARSFVFSTALPSCVVAASLAALAIVRKERHRVRRLWQLRAELAQGLSSLGFDIMGSETPIIPVRTRSLGHTLALSSFLFSQGIYAPAIRPPSVEEPRIRLTVTAAHTEKQIGQLLRVLKKGKGLIS